MNSNGKKISLRRAVTEADIDLLQEVLRDPTVNVQEYINSALSGDFLFGARTALHLACSADNFDVVSLLLSCGADVNIRDSTGTTPLFLASMNGCSDVVRLLLSHAADSSIATRIDGTTPLHSACEFSHVEVAGILIEAGANVSIRQLYQDKLTPLHFASCEDCPELVDLLVDHGADVNARAHYEYTPLHMACREGSLKAARRLLDRGADIEATSHSIKLSETALHWASSAGNLEAVDALIEYGALLDKQNAEGSTALHLAARNGHAGVALLLLTDGADIAITDTAGCVQEYEISSQGGYHYLEGYTALQIAIECGHANVVRIALSHGAQLNLCFNKRYGRYPLEQAVENGCCEVIRVLLEHKGAQLNTCGLGMDTTVLHKASEFGHIDIVKLLLKHGADCLQLDTYERTAIDVANGLVVSEVLAIEMIFQRRKSYLTFLSNYQFLRPRGRYPRESAIEKVFATRDLHRYIVHYL